MTVLSMAPAYVHGLLSRLSFYPQSCNFSLEQPLIIFSPSLSLSLSLSFSLSVLLSSSQSFSNCFTLSCQCDLCRAFTPSKKRRFDKHKQELIEYDNIVSHYDLFSYPVNPFISLSLSLSLSLSSLFCLYFYLLTLSLSTLRPVFSYLFFSSVLFIK